MVKREVVEVVLWSDRKRWADVLGRPENCCRGAIAVVEEARTLLGSGFVGRGMLYRKADEISKYTTPEQKKRGGAYVMPRTFNIPELSGRE